VAGLPAAVGHSNRSASMPKFSLISICCPLAIGLFFASQFVIGIGDAWHAIAWMVGVSICFSVIGLCFAIVSVLKKEKWRFLSYSAFAVNLLPVIFLMKFFKE
jgi:membrane-bound acyltransferase YfiQ involved in biofilm formation